jgi:hypothetical protein
MNKFTYIKNFYNKAIEFLANIKKFSSRIKSIIFNIHLIFSLPIVFEILIYNKNSWQLENEALEARWIFILISFILFTFLGNSEHFLWLSKIENKNKQFQEVKSNFSYVRRVLWIALYIGLWYYQIFKNWKSAFFCSFIAWIGVFLIDTVLYCCYNNYNISDIKIEINSWQYIKDCQSIDSVCYTNYDNKMCIKFNYDAISVYDVSFDIYKYFLLSNYKNEFFEKKIKPFFIQRFI